MRNKIAVNLISSTTFTDPFVGKRQIHLFITIFALHSFNHQLKMKPHVYDFF